MMINKHLCVCLVRISLPCFSEERRPALIKPHKASLIENSFDFPPSWMSFNSLLLVYCLVKCYHHLIVEIKQFFINQACNANKTIARVKPSNKNSREPTSLVFNL